MNSLICIMVDLKEEPTFTYAVEVCNEDKELYSLLSFLVKVKQSTDDINVLVDSGKETPEVKKVLDQFADSISVCYREHNGDFAAHRNYHIDQCKGDFIFMIDADEIPQEPLIQNMRTPIMETDCDCIYIPRMNICPGATGEWLEKCKFTINEAGFINWPDFQGRIFRNKSSIRWSKSLHEKVEGFEKAISLEANPLIGLWHVKSVEKQDKQDQFYKQLG